MTDLTLIPTTHAMALAYLKAGLAKNIHGDYSLGERWDLGGDYEVTTYIMNEVVPVAEKLVNATEMDGITKLYEFYGNTLPAALLFEFPRNIDALESCIKSAIDDAISLDSWIEVEFDLGGDTNHDDVVEGRSGTINFHPEELQIIRGANPKAPDEASVRVPHGNEITTCEGHFTDVQIRRSFKYLQNLHP